MLKNILTIAIGGTMALTVIGVFGFNSFGQEKNEEAEKPVMHDWECKYIILDGYHTGGDVHYVDEYIENIDGSITFVGKDGLLIRIPYPYFQVVKNDKESLKNAPQASLETIKRYQY